MLGISFFNHWRGCNEETDCVEQFQAFYTEISRRENDFVIAFGILGVGFILSITL